MESSVFKIKGYLLGLIFALICVPSQASLIGQEIGLGLGVVQNPDDDITFFQDAAFTNPDVFLVEEGVLEAPGFIDGFVDVDIEAETLGALFGGGVVVDNVIMSLDAALEFDAPAFIGLVFLELSWGAMDGEIVGISNLQTNIDGFTAGNILFDASNVAFNVAGLLLAPGSFIVADLDVNHIPVPSTLALMLLSLFGFRHLRAKAA